MLVGLIRRGIGGRRSYGSELAFESATFSLSTQVPRPTDRRTEDRIAPDLPVAKPVLDDREDFCRVRNISAGGVMVETTGYVPSVHTPLHIAFNSHQRMRGRVVWHRPPMMGIKFDETVDLREQTGRPSCGERVCK